MKYLNYIVLIFIFLMSSISFADNRRPYGLFTFPDNKKIIYVDALIKKQLGADLLNPFMLRVFLGEPGHLTELPVVKVAQFKGSGSEIFLNDGSRIRYYTLSGQRSYKFIKADNSIINIHYHEVLDIDILSYDRQKVNEYIKLVKKFKLNIENPTQALSDSAMSATVKDAEATSKVTKKNEQSITQQSEAANKEQKSIRESTEAQSSLAEAKGNEVITPFVYRRVNEKGNEDTFAGAFGFAPTPKNSKELKPNMLVILRHELQRQAMEAQKQSLKDGSFISTNKRFVPESLGFSIAIGGVVFVSALNKAHGDPLALERHILSIKDPVAHLSFYMFMQTQGFYMNFHTKKAGFQALDPKSKARMMTRLTYQGMALGSFVSSIVADLGRSVQMCTDQWLQGKTDDKSLESCDQAWTEWTVRNKFTQYLPQIVHLWISQYFSTIAQNGVERLFDKTMNMSFIKQILSSDIMIKTALKITGANVGIMFGPSGLVFGTLKFTEHVVFKLSVFIGVDHILMNYTYRPLNNIVQPALFAFDAVAINKLWYSADYSNWDENKINHHSIPEFEEEIKNFGVRMKRWREHLNSDAEADLAGWLEMTKEILYQMDYAYTYYSNFVGSLFETQTIQRRVNKSPGDKDALDKSALDSISRYPFRTLPFFGVAVPPENQVDKIEDLYLLKPGQLEQVQFDNIVAIAEKYKDLAHGLKGSEKTELEVILKKLASRKTAEMASGLNDFNKSMNLLKEQTEKIYQPDSMIYADPMMAPKIQYIYSPQFTDRLYKLKKALGNPEPIVYPFAGFSKAFAVDSTNKIKAGYADFSNWSVTKKFRFANEADLMFYKIICGDAESSFDKTTLKNINILSPQFSPPNLLKPIHLRNDNNGRNEFCAGLKSTSNLYSTKISNMKLDEYIVKYLNYENLFDIKTNNESNVFEKWWSEYAVKSVDHEFRDFDIRFKKIFELTHDNFFNERSNFKIVADSLNLSSYLPKSLEASLRMEAAVYLQILSRVLTKDDVIASNEVDYLALAVKNSRQDVFVSPYTSVPVEISKLNRLILNYIQLFRKNTELRMDIYDNQTQKIDTALNDIAVLVGLKNVISENESNARTDLSVTAAVAALEESEPFHSNKKFDILLDQEKNYEDIQLKNPTLKQRMSVHAINGLKMVVADIRRFIRMKISLKHTLELDEQEFKNDWNNHTPAAGSTTLPRKPGPVGR